MHEESRPLLLGFKTKQFSLYDKNINLNPLDNVLYALQLKKAYFMDLEEKDFCLFECVSSLGNNKFLENEN